jgi:hypothetical protein
MPTSTMSCEPHRFGSTFVRFSILAYDVWDIDNDDILDSEILDYMPLDGVKADEQTVPLPCLFTCTNSGFGDTDTPDCSLSYMISSVAL